MSEANSIAEILNPQAKKTYAQKLKDPRWDARRRQRISNAQGFCHSCRMGNKKLQIHHNFYDFSRDPWEYEDHELKCLCESCHERFHEQLTIFKRDILPLLDIRSLEVLNGALAVGVKFQKPLVMAHALAAIVSDPDQAEKLAYSFERK